MDVSKPIVLPKSLAYYKISPRNVEANTLKITALVTDAANAADTDVNFNDYDRVIFALGDPLTEGNSTTLVIKNSITDKTYYLVENRQK